MRLHLLCLIFLSAVIYNSYSTVPKASFYYYMPDVEFEHAYGMYTSPLSRTINGSDVLVTAPEHAPDFRMEETPLVRHYPYFYLEEERPYRISPAHKQLTRWYSRDNAYNLGCACTTVFRRFHLLAGCAAISTRHILTTATSTELILRTRRHFERMTEVLGIWYDINDNSFNSSYYAYPNRIHYHPRYVKPKEVNRSHPIPAMYDLSVWSTTYNLYGTSMSPSGAYICNRGGSHWMEYGSSVPGPRELALIAGFQFIKAYRRKPMPWFKYAVRTRKHTYPCPKSEWGWFHCIPGDWAPLGLDSGATYFRSLEGRGWRYDGLIGMNAVSMRLRSIPIVHYFTVLNTHEVLDFLYGAFTGHLPYEWLDQRYENTKERSPITKKVQVPSQYDPAHPYYYGKEIPNYK